MQDQFSSDADKRTALLRPLADSRQRVDSIKLCGIYFLFDGEELVYIGQALDILVRICTHKKDPSKIFDSFACRLAEPHELNEVEAYYIRSFWPTRYNYNGCQPRSKHEFYHYGVRTCIEREGRKWLVSAAYYDQERRTPATQVRTCKTLKAALSERKELSRSIAQELYQLRGGV